MLLLLLLLLPLPLVCDAGGRPSLWRLMAAVLSWFFGISIGCRYNPAAQYDSPDSVAISLSVSGSTLLMSVCA